MQFNEQNIQNQQQFFHTLCSFLFAKVETKNSDKKKASNKLLRVEFYYFVALVEACESFATKIKNKEKRETQSVNKKKYEKNFQIKSNCLTVIVFN